MQTLLAVDDNEAWLRTLTRWFAPLGYNIHTATTCRDAMNMTETLRPDCLLLDYNLGDGTAEDVCGYIRNHEQLKKTPIIVISIYEDKEQTCHGQCQADAFIYKCTSLGTIQGKVESILRRVDWERGVTRKGDLRLETANYQVFRDSKPVVSLSRDQFDFFTMLLEKSPDFVSEEDIAKKIFGTDLAAEKCDAIRGLAHRLRKKIGPQLGRRIKNKANLGWIYVQPPLKNTPRSGAV